MCVLVFSVLGNLENRGWDRRSLGSRGCHCRNLAKYQGVCYPDEGKTIFCRHHHQVAGRWDGSQRSREESSITWRQRTNNCWRKTNCWNRGLSRRMLQHPHPQPQKLKIQSYSPWVGQVYHAPFSSISSF